MTWGTLLVLVLIALPLVYSVRDWWKNRGKGGCSDCGGTCYGGCGIQLDESKIDQEKLDAIKAKHSDGND